MYDCINAKMRLPVEDYFLGVALPPHLSPFVEEKEGDYVPPEKLKIMALQRGERTGAAWALFSRNDLQSIALCRFNSDSNLIMFRSVKSRLLLLDYTWEDYSGNYSSISSVEPFSRNWSLFGATIFPLAIFQSRIQGGN